MTARVDWEDVIRAQGRCCACQGSLETSAHINWVPLDKYAKWVYPAWGNILARDPEKREVKRALAILCDRCIEEERSPKYAIEILGGPRRPWIMYWEVEGLEDADPITEEDLREGPTSPGLGQGTPVPPQKVFVVDYDLPADHRRKRFYRAIRKYLREHSLEETGWSTWSVVFTEDPEFARFVFDLRVLEEPHLFRLSGNA